MSVKGIIMFLAMNNTRLERKNLIILDFENRFLPTYLPQCNVTIIHSQNFITLPIEKPSRPTVRVQHNIIEETLIEVYRSHLRASFGTFCVHILVNYLKAATFSFKNWLPICRCSLFKHSSKARCASNYSVINRGYSSF